MLDIKTLVYSPEAGGDVLVPAITLDLDPSTATSPEAAARALHKAICASGYSNPKHIFLWSPEETAKRGYGNCWSVCWEEGPFEWALDASSKLHTPHWFSEPWNSFILCFERN